MVPTTALVVAERADAQPELVEALRAADFEVRQVSAAALAESPALGARSDVALISASLGLRRVALLSRRLAEAKARPSILVFPEDDLSALESCARAGFDYVAPPFSASLVRSRMTSCWERGQLTTAVEELAVAASLRDYERDLSIAHDIQAGFLPEVLPKPPGWEFASRFRPARLVSGDFYDGFELVDRRRLGFVVADVCDKGIGAALFMALIRTLLRHTATGASALSVGAAPLLRAVVGTNRYLARNHLRQGYFATVFFGVLDPDTGGLLYINCGHHPPVLIRADGSRSLLPPTGPAIGMLPDSEYALGHTTLAPGDSLLVYTDGVVEARDAGERQFGMDRMLAAATPAKSAEALLDAVDGALRDHVGDAEQSDDITMLALHRPR
jgi:serine phosphatase RsbU (regulator of sigma subunit)